MTRNQIAIRLMVPRDVSIDLRHSSSDLGSLLSTGALRESGALPAGSLSQSRKPLTHKRYPLCKPMTVCTAALGDLGKSLVLACDSMLSIPDASGDRVAFKLYPLTDRYQWWVMIAADDVTHIVPIIEAAVLGMLNLTDETNTRENVERIFVAAYQKIRLRYAEDLILSPLGVTFDQFIDSAEWQARFTEDLLAVNLGCEFLVAGFDWNGDGYIFSVEHPGIVRNHNVTGYASIGVGAYSAVSMLLHHSVNYEMELARVLYHVCEAKFMAESAPGVGKHTVVKIATSTGRMDAYEASTELIGGIRTAWEREGKPRVPSGFVEHLRNTLKRHPSISNGGD